MTVSNHTRLSRRYQWKKQTKRRELSLSSSLGLLQFTVMPFGLSGAPATFQQLMDQVLRGTEEFTGVYLDDIIIYGETWGQHLDNVRKVFE